MPKIHIPEINQSVIIVVKLFFVTVQEEEIVIGRLEVILHWFKCAVISLLP